MYQVNKDLARHKVGEDLANVRSHIRAVALYTLTSVCIFSILFSLHFQKLYKLVIIFLIFVTFHVLFKVTL